MEPPRELERGPKVVRKAFSELRTWMISQRPLPSLDCDIHETPQGRVILPKVAAGSGTKQTTTTHPFKVITRQTPGNPNLVQAGVVYHSRLFLSLRPNHKYPITGLLNEDQTSGWFNLIASDAIWLGITFDSDGQPTWAGIESWGQGNSLQLDANAWSGDNSYCEDDGNQENPKHQTSRKLIAYTTPGSDGKPVVTQVMFHDQILVPMVIDGRPAQYPVSHEGGYPL